MRCSAKWCTADPGSSHTPSFRRSRVCGAPCRFAACCAAPGKRCVLSKAAPICERSAGSLSALRTHSSAPTDETRAACAPRAGVPADAIHAGRFSLRAGFDRSDDEAPRRGQNLPAIAQFAISSRIASKPPTDSDSEIMSVTDHYIKLIEQSRSIFDAMSEDPETMSGFTRSHNFISDYELLRDAINSRPEARVLSLAIREYQFALFALAAGNYRHAFISLRLFLELSLSTIDFSASEIKYRKWLVKTGDIVWAALIDRENGIYSVSFISAFNCELAPSGKQYAALVEKVYRECSEHVHGNFHTHPPAARYLISENFAAPFRRFHHPVMVPFPVSLCW